MMRTGLSCFDGDRHRRWIYCRSRRRRCFHRMSRHLCSSRRGSTCRRSHRSCPSRRSRHFSYRRCRRREFHCRRCCFFSSGVARFHRCNCSLFRRRSSSLLHLFSTLIVSPLQGLILSSTTAARYDFFGHSFAKIHCRHC